MAAATDYFVYRFGCKYFNRTAAQWILFCHLSCWFTFYTLVRTYSNCIETLFTMMALSYWPWDFMMESILLSCRLFVRTTNLYCSADKSQKRRRFCAGRRKFEFRTFQGTMLRSHWGTISSNKCCFVGLPRLQALARYWKSFQIHHFHRSTDSCPHRSSHGYHRLFFLSGMHFCAIQFHPIQPIAGLARKAFNLYRILILGG